MQKPQVISVVRATPEHIRWLVENLYPADIAEIEAYGVSVGQALWGSFGLAAHCWAAVVEDGVVCVWGVSKEKSLLGGAVAWMLTSNLIDKYSRPFLRGAQPHLAALCSEYGYLENYVDSRHVRALRFFKWLGFEIEDGMLVGPNKILFHKICLRSYRGF